MPGKRSKKRRLRRAELAAAEARPDRQAAEASAIAADPLAPKLASGPAPKPIGRPIATAAWAASVALIAIFYLTLKMFAMNAYAGDEHIYLYQAKLVSEGIAPYSGFAMAHPPLQTLFTALVFKLFGYHFPLTRLLPVSWCLLGGLALSVMVLRELGAMASVASTALYLLSYEPLRASSHYTGVNMTVALTILAVFAFRLGAIRAAAGFCAAAAFTRLYAIPGVAMLAGFALLLDRRQGARLIGWTAGICAGLFFAVGLWTGFAAFIGQTLLYHAQKTPMGEETLASMRDTVLFHNASIAVLFILAQLPLVVYLNDAYQKASDKLGPLARFRAALDKSNTGLVLLSTAMAVFFLAILLSMNRIWMYYFIPAFPFAAIAGGWLVAGWLSAALRLARARGSWTAAGILQGNFIGGVFLAALFAAGYLSSPLLERNLGYYQRAMQKEPAERISTYAWKPGRLPDFANAAMRSILWRDRRFIGGRYNSFNYLLWHESRSFDALDEMVATIKRETSAQGEIFGDSGTVPLLALLSGKRIAANEVDTNIQRYTSGNADPEAMVKRIDSPRTEMIILRSHFGVAGVQALQDLISRKYTLLKSLRTSEESALYLIYKRI